MKVRAGYCTACGTLTWRICVAQRSDPRSGIIAGTQYLLWPRPDSAYAQLQTPTGYAPGIGFCRECCPKIGDQILDDFGPVVGIESAARYDEFRKTEEFWRAWLHDAMSLEPQPIDRLLEQWTADRQ